MSAGEGYMFDDFEVDQFYCPDQYEQCDQNVIEEWHFGDEKSLEIMDFEENNDPEKKPQIQELKISTLYEEVLTNSDSSEEELNQKTGATRSRSRNKIDPKRKIKLWTAEENEQLFNFYTQFNGNWERIAERIKERTVCQCKQHWQRLHKKDKKKSYWTEQEDQIIKANINYEENNWALIAQKLPNRTGKQIRERYINHLRSDIEIMKKQPWTEQEDEKLISLFNQLGAKWSQIAKFITGRSEIQIKNRTHKLCKANNLKPTPAINLVQDQQFKLITNDEIDDYLDLNQQIETCDKKSPKNKFNFDFSQCHSQTFSSHFKH